MTDEPIIKSLLDNDMYKFTMQQAVLELYPNISVTYRFKNRGYQRFDSNFLSALKKQIMYMELLSLTDSEYSWIKEGIPFFKPNYSEYLKNYHYNPTQVYVSLDHNKDLILNIKGPWHSTILWEVPLMAIISELYFKMIDTDWTVEGQEELVERKRNSLSVNICYFADFGTRRRRSFQNQDLVVDIMSRNPHKTYGNTFTGTSNLFLAMKYNVKPTGTKAHEWIMGISALESLRNANYHAMINWKRVYNGSLGIALPDTYGIKAFLNNFTLELSKLYDGVRHDSGDPFVFADKIIAHYNQFKIDPKSKTIIFSDGLNTEYAIKIKKYCENKIKCGFGIGTHFSNDFENSPALNMVIKLWSVFHNGMEVLVVKLPDTLGKVMGDPEAIRVAQWTFNGEKL